MFTYKQRQEGVIIHTQKALNPTQADAMVVVVDRNDVPTSRPRGGAVFMRVSDLGLRV